MRRLSTVRCAPASAFCRYSLGHDTSQGNTLRRKSALQPHLGDIGTAEEVEKGIHYCHVWDALGYHSSPLLSVPTHRTSTRCQLGLRPPEPKAPYSSVWPSAVACRVQGFRVSPVCEEYGCLWQWRPVLVLGDRHATRAETLKADETVYYMVPFVLLPECGVGANSPVIDDSVVRKLLPSKSLTESRSKQSDSASLGIFLPTPIGNVTAIRAGLPSRHPSWTSVHWPDICFQLLVDVAKAERTQAASAIISAPSPKRKAEAASEYASRCWTEWRNSIEEATTRGADYERVYTGDTLKNISDTADTESLREKRPDFFPEYCNALGGGLAELVLAVDRYAAMIARRELNLSAACWALLCDTKFRDVVGHLRHNAVAIEREMLAATEAQQTLHDLARRQNKTLLAKSSHTIRLVEYPTIAHWIQ